MYVWHANYWARRALYISKKMMNLNLIVPSYMWCLQTIYMVLQFCHSAESVECWSAVVPPPSRSSSEVGRPFENYHQAWAPIDHGDEDASFFRLAIRGWHWRERQLNGCQLKKNTNHLDRWRCWALSKVNEVNKKNVVNSKIKCDLINNVDFLCSPTNLILYHYQLRLLLVS